jgi:tRNA (cmo5U34)-methyltransferase
MCQNDSMTKAPDANLWSTPEHAQEYLRRADTLPHRHEGEAALLEFVPANAKRILDLGTGAGRLITLVKTLLPAAQFVGLDFSPTMLEILRREFGHDPSVTIVAHDLAKELPPLGRFDCVISSFAIHHLTNDRKRGLYAEIFGLLRPGGVFCNLEHVAPPTEALHDQFLRALQMTREQEDAENILLDLETQLRWLREIGFVDVGCHWKWRELALLAGVKPAGAS